MNFASIIVTLIALYMIFSYCFQYVAILKTSRSNLSMVKVDADETLKGFCMSLSQATFPVVYHQLLLVFNNSNVNFSLAQNYEKIGSLSKKAISGIKDTYHGLTQNLRQSFIQASIEEENREEISPSSPIPIAALSPETVEDPKMVITDKLKTIDMNHYQAHSRLFTDFEALPSDNSHTNELYTELTKQFFHDSIELPEEEQVLLTLGTYVPQFDKSDPDNYNRLIRTHQFMLEHYNTFQPYIKLMVFTKNVDILAFCEQQNITSISYYKTNHYNSPYFHSIVRVMKEFRSMYYGYIDSSIFLHSSILKLLSYIQSLIERNYLANSVILMGRPYLSDINYEEIAPLFSKLVNSHDFIDAFIEKNTLFTEPYFSFDGGYVFFTKEAYHRTRRDNIVLHRNGAFASILDISMKCYKCSFLDITHARMHSEEVLHLLVPSFMLRDIIYHKNGQSKAKDKGWNHQKSKNVVSFTTFNDIPYQVLMDQSMNYHLYYRYSYDSFVESEKQLEYIQSYLPSDPVCLYYTNSYANNTLSSLCSSVYVLYHDKQSHEELKKHFPYDPEKNVEEHIKALEGNFIYTHGICNHYSQYFYKPFKDLLSSEHDPFSVVFIDTVCPLHLLQYLNHRLPPSTTIVIKGKNVWSQRGSLEVIKQGFHILGSLEADYNYYGNGIKDILILQTKEDGDISLKLPL